MSPNRLDIRHDRKDLRQDRKQLQAAVKQYEDDVKAHKPPQVLLADLQQDVFNDSEADIKADEEDLKQDLHGH